MNDRTDVDRAISAWLSGQVPERAPLEVVAATRARVAETLQHAAGPRVLRGGGEMDLRWRWMIAIVAGAAILVGGIVVVGSTRIGPGPRENVPPVASPAATPWPSPWPSIRPFPKGHRDLPAGPYAWDLGDPIWMHNPEPESYGISVQFARHKETPGPDASPVTIAGYPGTVHTFITDSRGHPVHRYIVDMAGTWLRIDVEFDELPSDEHLAVASAIIDSIRHEPTPTGDAYRVRFTLPEGWDNY